ncbi:MAG: hypothetical protein QUS14_04095 [Pyrinomonadaceae bacterium]|nr:hypothetical protein [Pyrinomonadaceae bacterium]
MRERFAITLSVLMLLIAGLPFTASASPDSSRIDRTLERAGIEAGSGLSYDRRWKKRKYRRGSYYGYKNYGQYRRSRVGNRRYRLERRYYWRDGIRLTRYIRIYY